jgi:hypothetical protein
MVIQPVSFGLRHYQPGKNLMYGGYYRKSWPVIIFGAVTDPYYWKFCMALILRTSYLVINIIEANMIGYSPPKSWIFGAGFRNRTLWISNSSAVKICDQCGYRRFEGFWYGFVSIQKKTAVLPVGLLHMSVRAWNVFMPPVCACLCVVSGWVGIASLSVYTCACAYRHTLSSHTRILLRYT